MSDMKLSFNSETIYQRNDNDIIYEFDQHDKNNSRSRTREWQISKIQDIQK